ncbi:hypothetical protein QCA50_010389 [Cerrena zonata]|uniref:ATPase dynein-related AAA domain-containing protein n=1 Tax=Cerrena zonata TaxID=2478898 RepID=A0AAW0G785_9APHY
MAAQTDVVLPRHCVLRQQTVQAIYDQVKTQPWDNICVLVAGPPGSGKTTLKLLLKNHIHQQDPSAIVQCTTSWPTEEKRVEDGR